MGDPGPASDLSDLIVHLDHDFARPELLRCALTHASATAEHGGQDNERLEFLGDRVLGLVVADLLLSRFPEESEGDLARRHAALVRRDALARVAREIELDGVLRLSKGEYDSGGQRNPALLADACEAVIAAIYLDGGLAPARRFVERFWTPLLESFAEPPSDPKTALQEWAQSRGLPLPRYATVASEGPPHDPVFTVEARVEGLGTARGVGKSKRLAAKQAARRLLADIDRATP